MIKVKTLSKFFFVVAAVTITNYARAEVPINNVISGLCQGDADTLDNIPRWTDATPGSSALYYNSALTQSQNCLSAAQGECLSTSGTFASTPFVSNLYEWYTRGSLPSYPGEVIYVHIWTVQSTYTCTYE